MQNVHRLVDWLTPEHYSLTLDINRADKSFSGTVTIKGETHQNDFIRVHAKDLIIDQATVDGHTASFVQRENDELEITKTGLLPGKHIVVLGFSGTITDQMHGMYPCYFQHEGVKKSLIATQFESHHAREVFPCVDEPEAKATFDVTLITETDVIVLGNMPVVSQDEQDGKLVTSFDTTPRMSSYLLAWVYGHMQSKSGVTASGVDVNIWSTVAQPAESLDFALDSAIQTLDYFEEYFGVPYPLPKADHVALPDFSSGAMENWGLITYREATLLAHPTTTSVSSKRLVAMVIAHELSHQWFGNLVTMKWWDNLWLNESFANLMEYLAPDALHPEWNMWLDFAGHESVMALRRDAIDGVQPVQVEVHHPDEITSLFDPAIVYAKGGRLMRMLQYYIGHDAFRAGLQSYFKKYAYQNTVGDDLWNELSAASGKDVTSFMNVWISQPGYPVVSVMEDSTTQAQFFIGAHAESSRFWPIPLESTDESFPSLLETEALDKGLPLGERLNKDDTAHFITHYSDPHFDAVLQQLEDDALSPVDRLQFLHEQTLLARGGKLGSEQLIPLLHTFKKESVDSVWDVIGLSFGELKKFVDRDSKAEEKLRSLSTRVGEAQFTRLGWNHTPGEPETDTKLRASVAGLMVYGQDENVLNDARQLYESSTLETIEPEIRGLVLSVMVRHFSTPKLINLLVETYASTNSVDLQLDICDALTSTQDQQTIERLHSLMLNTEQIRTQDTARWFVYLIRNRDARDATWQWMKDNWSWIEEQFSGDKSYDNYPRYAASGLTTREQLEDYKRFFTPLMKEPALKRAIQLGIVEIQARVELIEKDKPAVEKALLNL